MKEYQIEVTETSARTITVTASDEDDAVRKVKEDYSNGDIVLDYTDFVDYNINPITQPNLSLTGDGETHY